MEISKKSTVEIFFVFFVSFGYIFCYSFAKPLNIDNTYFSVPFRIIAFLASLYIIGINFQNLIKRKTTVCFIALFWIFYLIKTIYSFNNYTYLPEIKSENYQIYMRIIVLNLVPSIAILSINLSKDIMMKINELVFNFLLIIITVSCLYTIFVTERYEKSNSIFASYYISTGHYGLSLIILSVFYYFQSKKLLEPILGVAVGAFTIFISSARSPILAILVILLVLLIYLNKLKYWLALISFAILFMVSIYYMKQTPLSEFEFVKRMYAAIFEGNAYGRSSQLLKGWNIFKSNMLFGGRTLFEDGMYPHNIFIEILMSMGLIGMILFCLYFKDLRKFKARYIKTNIFYIPFFLFFIQYLVLVMTSYSIFANREFWNFATVFISIILFCYNEEIKSNDSRGNATGNH